MPELIDRSLLIAYLAAIKPESYVSAYGEAAVDVINHVETYVNSMTTIEAESVRHGRWIEGTSRGSYSIYCSYCGSHKETICPSDYCPNCGAKMDGGDDNG